MTKIGFFFGILVLLLLANTCSADGLDLTVVPVAGTTVTPGGTISYTATVTDNMLPASSAEDVSFWIDRTNHPDAWTNPNWDYEFLPPTVKLESASDSGSSTLTLQIPADANEGTYTHYVYAGAKDSSLPQDFEPTIITFTVVDTGVTAVPEFPTVALPVAAVLGLLFIIGRKKEI